MFKLGEYLLFIVMASLLLGFLLVVYMGYIATKYLDEFESHLTRSKLIVNNRMLMGNSFLGRMYRLLQISSCLSIRNFSIKKASLIQMTLLNFPQHLARKIVWPSRLILFFGLIVLLGGGYGKYFNGYKL